MLKRWGLLVVLMAFLVSGCAEIAGQNDFDSFEDEKQAAPTVGDASFQDYQKQRQVEMQEIMQKRMMQGGAQNNRPMQVGPGQ